MIKSKKQMFLVIGSFTLVMLLVGTTYAFFNYTRTGGSNTVRTGRITFRTDENNTNFNLTNAFPVASSQATSNNPNVRTLSITVQGDTDYAGGVEYLVTAEDVHMNVGTGVNERQIPLAIEVSVSDIATGENAGSLGTSDSDYFTNKSNYASNHYNRYKILYDEEAGLSEGSRILVGYISPNTTQGSASTGVSGVINIKAYFDADKIAITDTLVGTEATNEYTNGTTGTEKNTTWVNGRSVFTTSEWNSIQQSGKQLSFKVKVESKQGLWVEAPVTTPPTCPGPGCEFIYTKNTYYYSALNVDGAPLSTRSTFAGNNDTLVSDYTTLNKDYFLGFKFDGSGNVTNAYVCGINANNNNAAFCIEGALSDNYGGSAETRTSVFTANVGKLNTAFPSCEASASGSSAYCEDSVIGYVYSNGDVFVLRAGSCNVTKNGRAYCD